MDNISYADVNPTNTQQCDSGTQELYKCTIKRELDIYIYQ